MPRFSARGLTFPGLGVVGGQQVLEDLAEQLGVERHFLFDRRILRNGELVAVQDVNQPADLGLAVAGLAVGRAEIDLALFAEEKLVGDVRGAVVAVGKSVDADVDGLLLAALDLIQALEQAAVHEGDGGEEPEGFVGVRQQAAVAIEVVGHEVLAVAAELALAHLLIERGEEEILHNGLVVAAILRLEGGKQCGHLARVEQGGGKQALFLEEPAENDPRDKPDQGKNGSERFTRSF